MDGARYHTLSFEIAQALRQHPVGDYLELARQLVEAQWAVEQNTHDQPYPAPTQQVERLLIARADMFAIAHFSAPLVQVVAGAQRRPPLYCTQPLRNRTRAVGHSSLKHWETLEAPLVAGLVRRSCSSAV